MVFSMNSQLHTHTISVGYWTDRGWALAKGYLSGGNESGPSIAFSPLTPQGFILLLQPFSSEPAFLTSRPLLTQFNEILKDSLHTFQVQVFGSCGRLCGDLGINLDSVEVVGVPGDYNIVPVVVIQWLIGVAFDQVGSIPQVRHIVQVTATRYGTTWEDATMDTNRRTWKHGIGKKTQTNKYITVH